MKKTVVKQLKIMVGRDSHLIGFYSDQMTAPSLGSKFLVAGSALELVFRRCPINVKQFVRDCLPIPHGDHPDFRQEIALPRNIRKIVPTAAARQDINAFWNIELA